MKLSKEIKDYIFRNGESGKPIEGLEEEMDKFFETMPVLEHENIFEDTFKNIARHFAQWGAERQKEQMMDEWLKDRYGCFWDGVEEGKKAMREQMMKEAVEKNGVVWDDEFVKFDDGTFLDFRDPTLCINPAFVLPKNGEKVKVIVIKED